MLNRPNSVEYPHYYEAYIQLVPDGNMVSILEEDLAKTVALFKNIPESESDFRYAPEKWSIKEVLGHMVDTERILSVRLLRFARGDETPVPGFNENIYVKGADFSRLTIQTLLDEFISVRRSTLALIKNMPEEAWLRKGTANNIENTARAIAYSIAGHELHHCQIIRDRYIKS